MVGFMIGLFVGVMLGISIVALLEAGGDDE